MDIHDTFLCLRPIIIQVVYRHTVIDINGFDFL